MIIMVETPVLFITFCRPDYARQTWEGIKAAKPKKLYFYSNKGRVEKYGEIERNNEIRTYVNEVDWDCEINTWFRDECVNVYDSLRGAIDWLFDNEEYGIILEEDCVPTLAFFSFVDQMIGRFRDEKDVWYVSGDNFYNLNPGGYDCIFTRYHWMYGWATWQDRWKKINWGIQDAERILDEDITLKLFKTKRQANNRQRQIRESMSFVKRTYCWDLNFGYTIDNNLGFGVIPSRHLIHNIGVAGQHHTNTVTTFVNVEPIGDLNDYTVTNTPKDVICDMEFDHAYHLRRRSELTYWKKFKSFLKDKLSYNSLIKLKEIRYLLKI